MVLRVKFGIRIHLSESGGLPIKLKVSGIPVHWEGAVSNDWFI